MIDRSWWLSCSQVDNSEGRTTPSLRVPIVMSPGAQASCLLRSTGSLRKDILHPTELPPGCAVCSTVPHHPQLGSLWGVALVTLHCNCLLMCLPPPGWEQGGQTGVNQSCLQLCPSTQLSPAEVHAISATGWSGSQQG